MSLDFIFYTYMMRYDRKNMCDFFINFANLYAQDIFPFGNYVGVHMASGKEIINRVIRMLLKKCIKLALEAIGLISSHKCPMEFRIMKF
jgi:hypothetical protein